MADRQGVKITPAAPAARILLRARPDALAPLSDALGVELPVTPCTSATNGDRSALWLGPDEWLVIGTDGDDLVAACGATGVLHSAVDISHRQLGFVVSGEGAAMVLAAGCPQDLRETAFPVGACSRTIFGKIEVIIWRVAADAFRVECGRSFADYLLALMDEAAKDVAA